MQEFLQHVVNGLLTGGGFALAALGLTLIFGVLNIVNFAHGAFYALGAYVALSFMGRTGLGYFLDLVVSMVVVGAFASALDPLIFRRLRGKGELPTIIASMGLSLIMVDGIRLLWGAAPQYLESPYVTEVIRLGSIIINGQLALVFVVALLLVGALYLFIEKTWMGLQIRMLAQDEVAAQLMGVNIHRTAAATWAISGALTAAAGVLVLPVFALNPFVGDSAGLTSFAVVIFGGVGSVLGTVLAGFVLAIGQSLAEGYLISGITEIVAFTLMILVLILRPKGLLGKGA